MIGKAILKFALAGAVFAFGLAAVSPVAAAPDDCADCTPAPSRYDTEEVIKKIQEANRAREVSNEPRASAGRRAETKHGPALSNECADCPPPRKYDDRKVVKKVRNIDHSRVIDTYSVVPAGRRARETNRLVVHKNETRHVGVVQHNHTIVEKETRYVHRVPAVTRVEFVTRKYHVVEKADTVSVPVVPRVRSCRRHYGRYGSCVVRVRG